MPAQVFTSKGAKIELKDKPLGTPGAEGAVYDAKSVTHEGKCVKIYYEKLRTKEKDRKIRYMIENPPTQVNMGKCTLCWPIELVYEDAANKKFIGFMMHKAVEGSINLYELCKEGFTPGIKLDKIWEKKYGRNNVPHSLISRLKLSVNIASGVHAIHQSYRYVLVDFKPQNILITHDGQVFFIDLDSVQIQTPSEIFHAQYSSLGYAPKEGKNIDIKTTVIHKTWDYFSLGVVLYQLIVGIHPYTVTAKDPPGGTTLNDHIFNGLFPFGGSKHLIAKFAPDHQLFNKLPPAFKNLFLKCFDVGNSVPSLRPAALDWGEVIFRDLKTSENYFKSNPPVVKILDKPVPAPTQKTPFQPLPQQRRSWLSQLIGWLFG